MRGQRSDNCCVVLWTRILVTPHSLFCSVYPAIGSSVGSTRSGTPSIRENLFPNTFPGLDVCSRIWRIRNVQVSLSHTESVMAGTCSVDCWTLISSTDTYLGFGTRSWLFHQKPICWHMVVTVSYRIQSRSACRRSHGHSGWECSRLCTRFGHTQKWKTYRSQL